MMRKKHQPTAHNERATQPDNLLDLNRSLTGYAYQPEPNGDTTLKEPIESEKPKRPVKKVVLWTISIILLIGIFTGGWVAWKLLANEVKVFGWGGLFSLLHKTKLKGEDEGHVNILLAGNSADDANHGGATLTDSIMIVSVNTKAKTAFMLSVPRDLYVNIPGNGYAKINEAYQDGEQGKFDEPGYPKGGMGLLEKTVSQNFGITFHYYALVDYAAVRDAVNAVGGINVTITSSDPRGLYDPSPDLNNNRLPLVKLPNGVNKLNGTQALALARARGNSYGSYGYATSDFQRTKNQQAILVALKDKTISTGTLANPVKLGQLFDSIGNNVNTDMTLGEARRGYDIGKDIKNSDIKSVGLNDVDGKNLFTSYRTRLGQSALIPRNGVDDFDEIKSLVQTLLNPPVATTPKS
jgi:polyisoprenyl-teichoic acid--peptidoglycan teichoic acid transferase